MADEGGLAYLIQVAVDSSSVGPGISEAENLVASGMARINESLQQSSSVQAFQQLIEAGQGVEASLREITAAARGAQEVLAGLAEARRLLSEAGLSGTATTAGSLAGVSQAELAAEQIRLQQLRSQGNDALSPANRILFNKVDQGTIASAEELAGALAREGLSAERAQAAMESLARLGYRQLAEEARVYIAANDAVVASENAVGQAFRQERAGTSLSGATVESVNEMTAALREQYGVQAEILALRERMAGATPALTTANLRNQVIDTQIGNAEEKGATPLRITQLALQQEQADQAAANAEAAYQRTLRNPQVDVAAERAKLEALVAPAQSGQQRVALVGSEVATERTNQLLQNQVATREQILRSYQAELAAANRLQAAQDNLTKQAEKQAAAAAGGGGFFSGIGRGLGAHDGSSGSEDLGFQVGQVARYVVYYQIFREIETAIKDSISETIEFERGVTNLSLVLGTSRENARGLATELGNVAAANGLNPSQGAALGGQFAGSFSDQQGADPATLALQGANVGSQLAVVSGTKEVAKNLFDATASVHGFNLEADSTNRVLDAATNAAGHFLGALDPSKILPGLAQIGDVAAAAGFSVEQTAALLGAVQQRTGSDSAGAAQEIRRILGREGQPAFQAVFAQQGIDTSQPLQQELTQLSEKYDTLSESQKRAITSQLGGSRGGAAVQAIIEGYSQINDAADASLQNGGAFARAYGQRLNDLRGVITQLRGEFGLLAKDLGESGVFDGLGVALKVTLSLVQAVDDVLQAFDAVPRPIRTITAALGEALVAVRLLGSAGITGFGIGAANARLDQGTARFFGGRTLPGGSRATAEEGATTPIAAAGAAGAEEITAASTALAGGVATAGQHFIASIESLALQLSRVGAQETLLSEEVANQQRLAAGFRLNSAGQVIGANGRFAASANTAALAAQDTAAAEAAAQMKAGGTAIEAAEVAAAEQVSAGSRVVGESLDGAGVYISRAARAAAAEIEAAGAQGAAGIRTGSVAGGEVGAAEGAGVGSAARGGSAVPLLLGALVVGTIADSVVRAVGRENSASKAANAVTITGTTADDLRTTASSAKTLAEQARQSSSGLTGSLTNLLRGDPTGSASAQATRVGNLAAFEAQQLDAATARGSAATSAADSGNIDLTTVGGVAVAFKEMTAQGATASQQLDALSQRLAEFIQASQAGVDTLTAAQTPRLSQDIADSATNALNNQSVDAQQVQAAFNSRRGGHGERVPGGTPPTADQQALASLRGVDLEQFNSGLASTVDVELQRQGVANGGTVNRSALLSAVQKAAPQILSQIGLSAEHIKALGSALTEAEQTAVNDALAAATASRGQKLTGAQAGEIGAEAIKLMPQIAAETSNRVATGGGTAAQQAQGPDLAGATAARDHIKKTYDQLLKASTGVDEDLKAVNLELAQGSAVRLGAAAGVAGAGRALADLTKIKADDKAKIVALSATGQALTQADITEADDAIAHVGALGQLAAAQAGGLGKYQAIQNQIGVVQQQIALAANDTKQLPQLATALATLETQSGDQAEADAEALILAGVKVGDAMSAALAQYKIAVMRLALLQQKLTNLNGATYASQVPSQAAQSPDITTLQQGVTQTGVDLQLQQITDKTNSAVAGLDPQQTVQIDKTQIQGTKDKLAALAKNNLQGTTDYVAAQTELKNQLRTLSTDQAAAQSAAIAAGAGISESAQKAAAVAEAQAKLKGDLPGSTQYNQDLGALHAAQASQAKAAAAAAKKGAQDDPFNADLEASIDPRDTLALAAAKLTEDAHAAASATTRKARAEGRLGLVKDQLALAQAQAAEEEAKRSATTGEGNSVDQAITALANARQQLSLDLKGTQQYWQDYRALQDAKYQLAQANLDQSKIVDQLHSDSTDPVAQARLAVLEARRKLNADKRDKTGNIQQDELDLENAKTAEQKAQFDAQLQQQQTAYSLGQESAKTYGEFLNQEDKLLRSKIAGMKKGQEGYQQYVDELNTIDQAIQSLNNQLQGQFNLGTISLPTVYEVRRQVAANSAGGSTTANTVINNKVEINGADLNAVIAYINSVLGKSGAVVATTGRKAA